MEMAGGTVSEVLVAIPLTTGGLRTSFELRPRFHSFISLSHFKRCPAFGITRLGTWIDKSQPRRLTVRASSNPSNNSGPVFPVDFESPAGQLLAQILHTHPHLLPAAIDQQLENLQTERDAQREEVPPSQDLLYKRIAEVKKKERRRALEEIIYFHIVQKFLDSGISMIPKLSTTSSDPTGRIDFWPNQEQKLKSVHSPEAFELIQSHLTIVLGERQVGPLATMVQISKIKLGKLYAASIMYGYFLKRVDERYQLERTMNTLPKGLIENQPRLDDLSPTNWLWDTDSLISIPSNDDGEGGYVDTGEEQSYRLRTYVMYLDADTLQRYATIRSKEAFSLIERQTQALFGRPNIRVAEDGTLDAANDEVITITFSGLTLLVLEAVALGSFLWDAESYVESKYHFINS